MSSKREFDHERAVDLVVDRLHEQHPEVPSEQLTDAVEASVGHLEQAPITDFVDVLAEREVRDQLDLGAKRGLL